LHAFFGSTPHVALREASAWAMAPFVGVPPFAPRPLRYLRRMWPSMTVTSPRPVSMVTTFLSGFQFVESPQTPLVVANVMRPQFTRSLVVPTTSR
jgi:hypothetical protein